MAVLLSCPRGHRWESDRAGTLDQTCPTCGSAGETVVGLETSITGGSMDELPPAPRGGRDPSAQASEDSPVPPPAGTLLTPQDEPETINGRHDRAASEVVPSISPGGPLPERFGRYRVLRQIGKGGMGSVHLAQDTQLDRKVALKVPRFEPDDGALLLRFQREARAAATLEHPNICSIYDVGQIGGIQYLSMAYIEGRTLAELIRDQHPLPQRSVADLVRKLALAMEEAHAKGVIHRDLKPANIMVNQRHEPVIMDFGLARRDSGDDARLTAAGAVMGTPAYMAPEQLAGDSRQVGPAADIYALGGVLYELITGRLPLEGSLAEVLGKIRTEPPAPLSTHRKDVDPTLEAICLKALNKRPEDRFESMRQFAAALDEFIGRRDEAQGTALATLPAAAGGADLTGETPNVPAAAPASGDGATDLLAKLAARLESLPAQADSRVTVEHRLRMPWLLGAAAAAVLLLAAAVVALAVYQSRPQYVTVRFTHVEVLLAQPGDTFEVAGREVTPEELKEGVSVEAGKKTALVVKRNGKAIKRYPFTADAETTEQVVPIPPKRSEPALARPDVKVDPTLAVWAERYYGSSESPLHSTLFINGERVGELTTDAQLNIAGHVKPGWNTFVLETSPHYPAKDWNSLNLVVGRVSKTPEGKEVMTPWCRLFSGEDWKLEGGKFSHRSSPEAESVRLTMHLYYGEFARDDRELKEGDFVLQAEPYYNSSNPAVTATVFINGTPLPTFGTQPRQVVITDLLQPGDNEVKIVSRRVDGSLADNDITLRISGPAEHNAAKGEFELRPMALLSARTGWLRNEKTDKLVNPAAPESDAIERTMTVYLAREPARVAETPDKPTMMVWSQRYYGGGSESSLHSELLINGRRIGLFSSDTREPVGGALVEGDWNAVTLRTIARRPAAGENELTLQVGLAAPDGAGELTMRPLWKLRNGDDWRLEEGRLKHRSDPNAEEVTLKFWIYYAGLERENQQVKAGDYLLSGRPYYESSVTSVTATVWVNGQPLSTFCSERRDIVITPLLKEGVNEIRLETRRVEGSLQDNDILFTIGGPAEYSAAAGKFTFEKVEEFDSLTGWRRDAKSSVLSSSEDENADKVVRVIRFEVRALPSGG